MKNKIYLLSICSLLLMPVAALTANAKTLPDAEQWTESTSMKSTFGWGNYEGTQTSITADSTDKKAGKSSIKYTGIHYAKGGALGPALIFPAGHYLDISSFAGGTLSFDIKLGDTTNFQYMQLALMSDGVQAHQINRNIKLQAGWNHLEFPLAAAGEFKKAGWNGAHAADFNPAAVHQIRFRLIYLKGKVYDSATPRDVWFDGIAFTNAETDSPNYTILEQKSIAEDIKIAPGKTRKMPLPPLNSAGSYLLKVTIRRDNPVPGGYGAYAMFTLNGEPVDGAKNRYQSRLLNKPLSFVRETGLAVPWSRGDGLWQTIFSPSFDTSFKRYSPSAKDPYTYVLDVSDLIAQGKPNTFEITSMVRSSVQHDIVASVDWIAAQLPQNVADVESPAVSPLPALNVTPDGAMQIAAGEKPLAVESSFSVPGGGQNHFGNTSKEALWKPQVTREGNGKWKVEASGKYYQLVREIHQTNGRIEVRDTFRNLTDKDVGIIFTNEFNLSGHPGINYLRIGGLRAQGVNNINSAGNPTLFFPMKNSSLTMVAEDDFYRNQGNFYFDTDTKKSGISDSMFALAPHAAYTMKWSIYTLPSADYFYMINRLRRDWDVNFTMQGPLYFTNYHGIAKSTPDQLRKMIDKNHAKYIAFWEIRTQDKSSEWDNKRVLGRGAGMLKPELREQMELEKQAVANLHAADPNIKVANYNHAFFVAPEKENDPEYKDSWIIDAKGERAKSQYSDDVFYVDRTVYPTLTNSYGKAFLRQIDYVFDETKVDWLYWDESNGPGMTQPGKEATSGENLPSNITFNAWDGHSAVIDPATGMIVQKIGILPILSSGVFKKAIQKAKDHGGIVQFNGVPTTSMRQHSQTQSFVESQWDMTRVYSTHLSTPMAFGLGSPDMATLRRTLDFGTLYARTTLNYDSDIVTRFYPFTPIELHEGWVKGKERIITNRSGDFGWDGAFAAALYLYDKDGKVAKTQQFEKPVKKVSIEVPDGGIAILERRF